MEFHRQMHSISQGQHSSDTWVDQEHSVVNSDPALDVNKSGGGAGALVKGTGVISTETAGACGSDDSFVSVSGMAGCARFV